jgi:hypothetical protein
MRISRRQSCTYARRAPPREERPADAKLLRAPEWQWPGWGESIRQARKHQEQREAARAARQRRFRQSLSGRRGESSRG